jgi:hypothetical protein
MTALCGAAEGPTPMEPPVVPNRFVRSDKAMA